MYGALVSIYGALTIIFIRIAIEQPALSLGKIINYSYSITVNLCLSNILTTSCDDQLHSDRDSEWLSCCANGIGTRQSVAAGQIWYKVHFEVHATTDDSVVTTEGVLHRASSSFQVVDPCLGMRSGAALASSYEQG